MSRGYEFAKRVAPNAFAAWKLADETREKLNAELANVETHRDAAARHLARIIATETTGLRVGDTILMGLTAPGEGVKAQITAFRWRKQSAEVRIEARKLNKDGSLSRNHRPRSLSLASEGEVGYFGWEVVEVPSG